jgi:hypothetical protein
MLSVNYSSDARATGVSQTVCIHDYTARTNVVTSIFIPELQVFEIQAFFLVDPVHEHAGDRSLRLLKFLF